MSESVLKWYSISESSAKPDGRWGHSCCLVGGRYLVIVGGLQCGRIFNDTWVFDLETRKWAKCLVSGDIPSPRWGHSGTLISGNTIIFLGGREGAKPVALNEYHTLDLKTMTWRRGGTVKPSPKSRYAHGALCISGLPTSPNLPFFQPSVNNSNPNFPTFNPIRLRTDIDTSDIPPPPAPDMESPPKTVLVFGGHGGRTRYYADTHLIQLPANIEVLQKYVSKYSYAVENFESESAVPVTSGIAIQPDTAPDVGNEQPTDNASSSPTDPTPASATSGTDASDPGIGVASDGPAPLKGDILLAAPVVTAGTGTGAMASEDLSPGTLIPLGVQTPECLPTVGLWSSPAVAGTPPSRRSGHSITLQGENVIVIGGYNGSEILMDIGILNLRTWCWSIPQIVGDRLPPLVGHSADLLPQTSWIFIFGGSISATELSAATFALDVSNPSVVSTTLLHTTCKKQAPAPRFWHRTVLVMGSTRREPKSKKKKSKGTPGISLAKTLPLPSSQDPAVGTGLGASGNPESSLKPEVNAGVGGMHSSGSTGNLSDPVAVVPSERMSPTGAGSEDEQFGMETQSFSGVSTVYQALVEERERDRDPSAGMGGHPGTRKDGNAPESGTSSVYSSGTVTADGMSHASNPVHSSVDLASTNNAALPSVVSDPKAGKATSASSVASTSASTDASTNAPVYYHILLFGGSGEWGQSFNEVSALDISPIVHARKKFMKEYEETSGANEATNKSTTSSALTTGLSESVASADIAPFPPLLSSLSHPLPSLLPGLLSDRNTTTGASLTSLSSLSALSPLPPLTPLTADQLFQQTLKEKFGLRKDVQHMFFEARKQSGEFIGLLGNTMAGASSAQRMTYTQVNGTGWIHPMNVVAGRHVYPHMMHSNVAANVSGHHRGPQRGASGHPSNTAAVAGAGGALPHHPSAPHRTGDVANGRHHARYGNTIHSSVRPPHSITAPPPPPGHTHNRRSNAYVHPHNAQNTQNHRHYHSGRPHEYPSSSVSAQGTAQHLKRHTGSRAPHTSSNQYPSKAYPGGGISYNTSSDAFPQFGSNADAVGTRASGGQRHSHRGSGRQTNDPNAPGAHVNSSSPLVPSSDHTNTGGANNNQDRSTGVSNVQSRSRSHSQSRPHSLSQGGDPTYDYTGPHAHVHPQSYTPHLHTHTHTQSHIHPHAHYLPRDGTGIPMPPYPPGGPQYGYTPQHYNTHPYSYSSAPDNHDIFPPYTPPHPDMTRPTHYPQPPTSSSGDRKSVV